MVTKSATKPKKFSPPKRDWSVLTATDPKHVKRLEHIQETLDAAIDAIQEEGGVEDWEDFKNFVESFNKRPERLNESGNQKASISVDLVTEGKNDEVSGFVFYLTKDPTQRTSGVYLVKNLKQAGVDTKENNNFYTPSHVSDLIDLEANDQLDDDDLSEDFDDDLTDLEEDEELSKPQKAISKLGSFHRNNKKTQNREEDDIDELLSEDNDTPLKTGALGEIAKNRTSQKSIKTPEQSDEQYPLLESLEAFLKESQHQGSIINAKSSEIDGLTVTGLTLQATSLMGLLAVNSIQELIDGITQAKENNQAEKLEEILEQIKTLNERTEEISIRARQTDVIADLETLAERTESLSERTQKIKPNKPSQNQSINSKVEKQQANTEQNDPILVDDPEIKAIDIGEKIDKLGNQIDPNYKRSPPLQINKNVSLDQQLDQIQDYLGKLSERLDRLEEIVEELEQTIKPQVSTQSHSELNSTQPVSNPLHSSVPSPSESLIDDEPEDLLSKIVTQKKVQQQREAVADCLVNYALATGQSPESGIPFDEGGTLYVTSDHQKIQVAVIGSDGQDIFSGTKEGERWKFEVNQDKLTPEEREAIFKLPQTEAEYDKLATAQALVETFQSAFPKRFKGETEPIFSWREPRESQNTPGAIKYEFEILDLPNGSKQLIGTDPRQNDAAVFDAILVSGKPPEIRECRIPIAEMEQLLDSSEQPSKTQSSSQTPPERNRSFHAPKPKNVSLNNDELEV